MELQNIIHEYGNQYRQNHNLTYVQSKALSCIEKCRTSDLGGHTEVCADCGCYKISYNSCRNRNCPKCQTLAKERWIDNQKSNLLNIGYFHVVFTIPDILNPIVYQNQVALYNLLFKATAETLTELASNGKYLGASIGFTTVLHTCYSDKDIIPILHTDNRNEHIIQQPPPLNIGIIIIVFHITF